ncbi:uncharacterized protein [Nicotiana tomentosiformis]|uniref:uncharacterized protein n=1 Tax=Nicotiana tomentosiformis TaxID=4098 RepID=UPI00388C81B6
MDQESTAQNSQNVARQGDLSPRHMKKAKLAAKGRKMQQKDNNTVHTSGDFNVIWDEEEKYGGLPVFLNETDVFRHCINTCNLFDLGFKGIEVTHLSKIGSDHSPMQLKCDIKKIESLEEVVLVHEAQFEVTPTKLNRERLHKVQADLIRFLALEEKYWKQKSGMAWFKHGDRNTKVFHTQIKGRRKRIYLKRIQNNQGMWIEEDEEIAVEAVNFYKE